MYVLQSLHNGWAQGSVQSAKAVQEGQWPKSAQWIAYSHANFFSFSKIGLYCKYDIGF